MKKIVSLFLILISAHIVTWAGNTVAVPSESEDVMLQGFYWDSHSLTKYGRTKWVDFNNNNYAPSC